MFLSLQYYVCPTITASFDFKVFVLESQLHQNNHNLLFRVPCLKPPKDKMFFFTTLLTQQITLWYVMFLRPHLCFFFSCYRYLLYSCKSTVIGYTPCNDEVLERADAVVLTLGCQSDSHVASVSRTVPMLGWPPTKVISCRKFISIHLAVHSTCCCQSLMWLRSDECIGNSHRHKGTLEALWDHMRRVFVFCPEKHRIRNMHIRYGTESVWLQRYTHMHAQWERGLYCAGLLCWVTITCAGQQLLCPPPPHNPALPPVWLS